MPTPSSVASARLGCRAAAAGAQLAGRPARGLGRLLRLEARAQAALLQQPPRGLRRVPRALARGFRSLRAPELHRIMLLIRRVKGKLTPYAQSW